jgi:pimeloyl-ACP methyl ester carboxylesterase
VGLVLVLAGCAARPGSWALETALDGVVFLQPHEVAVPEVPRLEDSLSLSGRRVGIGEGIHLYVLEEGAGPPVVLVNGGPGNTLHSFLPHFSAAAPFARVIYYDQRGTGLSDWVPGADGYSTAQSVDDLERLRLALGIERWFVLGHSYGGLIAQRYALRHPEQLLGLVLVGSSVPMEGLDLGERDYRSDAERTRIRDVYAIDGEAVVPVHGGGVDLPTLQRMVYNGYLNGDWKRQYFLKPSPERMAQIARYEWVHDRDLNRQVAEDGFGRDLRGVFRDCPIPTLIVEGAHDANWGPDKPALFAAEHPNAELVVIDQAAHFPFGEQPAAFFGRLERFLRSVPPVDPTRVAAWKASIDGW